MENVNENAGRPATTKPRGADERPPGEPDNANDASSVWEELRSRREKPSRRIGEGWERVSESAKGYADEHSIGVALGSLGVGVGLGVLIGILAARD